MNEQLDSIIQMYDDLGTPETIHETSNKEIIFRVVGDGIVAARIKYEDNGLQTNRTINNTEWLSPEDIFEILSQHAESIPKDQKGKMQANMEP